MPRPRTCAIDRFNVDLLHFFRGTYVTVTINKFFFTIQCDKYFRPFALLLARTFLPPLVFIRCKNPCLLFLTKLLG